MRIRKNINVSSLHCASPRTHARTHAHARGSLGVYECMWVYMYVCT